MKSFIFVFFAVMLTCFSFGCSSLEVHTDWDRSANFSALKTYSWESAVQPKTGNPQLDNDILNSRIRSAVDQTLADKGFQKIASGTPDFQVRYELTVDKQMDVDSMPGPYGYGGWMGGGQIFTIHYEVGTMILDITNAATKKLIWRGSGEDMVEPAKTPEQRDAKLNRGVDAILKDFPPGPSNKPDK